VELEDGLDIEKEPLDYFEELSDVADRVSPLAERYLQRDLDLHLHVRVRTRDPIAQRHDVCVLLKRSGVDLGLDHLVDIAPDLALEGIGIGLTDREETSVDHLVLIHVRQVGEAAEGVVLRGVPSSVRLRSVDDCPVALRDWSSTSTSPRTNRSGIASGVSGDRCR
jgi:hypothetical protein